MTKLSALSPIYLFVRRADTFIRLNLVFQWSSKNERTPGPSHQLFYNPWTLLRGGQKWCILQADHFFPSTPLLRSLSLFQQYSQFKTFSLSISTPLAYGIQRIKHTHLWPLPGAPQLLALTWSQMGFCDKSRMNSDYPPPSSHRPLAWFDVWSQSENYADGLKCFLLLPGCDGPSI